MFCCIFFCVCVKKNIVKYVRHQHGIKKDRICTCQLLLKCDALPSNQEGMHKNQKSHEKEFYFSFAFGADLKKQTK